MSISENKRNALSDDDLSAVTGGAAEFKDIDELNATTTPLSGGGALIVGDVTYRYANAETRNFLLYRSDTGATLLVAKALFYPENFPKKEDSGNT